MFTFDSITLLSFVILVAVIIAYRLGQTYLLVRYSDTYYRVLNTSIQHAYSMVYKNHIISLIANNIQPTNEDVNRLRSMFVDLVKKTAGPNVIKQLTKLHGSKTSLDAFLVLMFDDLLDKDLLETKSR